MVEYYEYPPASEEEIEDAQDEEMEDQMEKQQDLMEDITPQYKSKEDLYTLFWKIIQREDSSKVGNLDKTELGMLNISVRDCQKIALLADDLGHPGFATFFKDQAEIILATSMSKKGWLQELFVLNKRVSAKLKDSPQGGGIQEPQPKKKGLFGRK